MDVIGVAPEQPGTLGAVPVEPEPVTRQERKRRTREALLDAALDLLADHGFDGLSLREVTKAVDIVPTAFYRHFTSMDELGLTLVERSMGVLREIVGAIPAGTTEYRDAIEIAVRALDTQVRANVREIRFVVREQFGGSQAVRHAVRADLRMLAMELAVVLARFECLRGWAVDELRMLAELMITAMLASGAELIEAGMRTDIAGQALRIAGTRLRLIAAGAVNWVGR